MCSGWHKLSFYVAKGMPTCLKVFNCKCIPPFWKLENNIFSSLLFFLYSFLSLLNLTKFSVKCFMHAWRFLSCCENFCLALISQILELVKTAMLPAKSQSERHYEFICPIYKIFNKKAKIEMLQVGAKQPINFCYSHSRQMLEVYLTDE